jgi:hypothetical protein
MHLSADSIALQHGGVVDSSGERVKVSTLVTIEA